MADPDLQAELDRLYGLPLAEFIGARNELAKSLRASGYRQAADQVKALVKPSMTAWAVNALFHQERRRLDDLLQAAAAVRAALAGQGDRRKADAQRREALQAVLSRAVEILAAAGYAATPANRQRISHTLETLAARDPREDGPPPGRLTRDLEPQGFDVLAGFAASLAAPAAAGSTKAVKHPSGGKRTPDSAAAGERDERLETARRQLEERQEALARLERGVEEAEAAASEALERYEQLAEELAEARRHVEAAGKAAAAAKTAVAAARAAAGKAKTARRQGLSRLATARRKVERLED